ncbi:MAG: dihydrodipicolinate synthase family protein [Clostridia bacterium]|nr:dihydrodipicolinate synthase family protein [Clostridia bacterium]
MEDGTMQEKRFPSNPIALATLPWKKDWSFDKEAFAREVEMLQSKKIFTIYYGCTAGEGYALTNTQYREITSFFADIMKGYEYPPMVSVISTSMAEMIERVEMIKSYGIHDIMFTLPSWGTLRPSEVGLFLHGLMDAHPDCRFLHYNNSLRSKVRLYAEDYEKYAKEIPNFVAVKQALATPLDVRLMAERDVPLQEFYMEYLYTYACMFSNPSYLVSMLCINYDKAIEYYEAGQRKDFKKLTQMDMQIQKASDVFDKALPHERIDGAYDKLFTKMHIPEFSKELYPPYEGVSDQEYEGLLAALKTELPDWF